MLYMLVPAYNIPSYSGEKTVSLSIHIITMSGMYP